MHAGTGKFYLLVRGRKGVKEENTSINPHPTSPARATGFAPSRAPQSAPHRPSPPAPLLLEGGELIRFAFTTVLARAGFRPAGRTLGAEAARGQVPKMALAGGVVLAAAGPWAVLSRSCGRAAAAPLFGAAAYSSVPAVNSRDGQQREGELWRWRPRRRPGTGSSGLTGP